MNSEQKEKKRLYNRLYYETNRARLLVGFKRYYERTRLRRKQYRQEHREEHRLNARSWRLSNRERYLEILRRSSARHRQTNKAAISRYWNRYYAENRHWICPRRVKTQWEKRYGKELGEHLYRLAQYTKQLDRELKEREKLG